eukprot:Gb_26679 [translate_table: standard]
MATAHLCVLTPLSTVHVFLCTALITKQRSPWPEVYTSSNTACTSLKRVVQLLWDVFHSFLQQRFWTPSDIKTPLLCLDRFFSATSKITLEWRSPSDQKAPRLHEISEPSSMAAHTFTSPSLLVFS